MSYAKELLSHEIKRLKGLVTDREERNARFKKMDTSKEITKQVTQNKSDIKTAEKLIKELQTDAKKL